MTGSKIDALCVFCGSSLGNKPNYESAAIELGQLLAGRGIRLVYGGGNVGLMGVIADAAMASGGEVIGVIPKGLADREVAHEQISQLHIVDSMHDRKAMMARLADGFIALPGGYGTLEEFCEIVTWYQLGLHRKPCGILNIDGYFDGILSQFDHGVTEKFVLPEHRKIVLSATDSVSLLDQMADFRPLMMEKWIENEET